MNSFLIIAAVVAIALLAIIYVLVKDHKGDGEDIKRGILDMNPKRDLNIKSNAAYIGYGDNDIDGKPAEGFTEEAVIPYDVSTPPYNAKIATGSEVVSVRYRDPKTGRLAKRGTPGARREFHYVNRRGEGDGRAAVRKKNKQAA